MSNTELEILVEWLEYKVSTNHGVEWSLDDTPENRELAILEGIEAYGYSREEAEANLCINGNAVLFEDTGLIKVLVKKIKAELEIG